MSNEEIKQIKETLKYYETTKTEPTYCEELITTGELKRIVEEIERLNNILIELVKWLHSEIKRLDKMQDTYDKHGKKKDPNIIYISGAYIEVLDKLQELTVE